MKHQIPMAIKRAHFHQSSIGHIFVLHVSLYKIDLRMFAANEKVFKLFF